MNRRNEKINLLKGLLKGSKKLTEVFHPPVIISISTKGTTFKNKNTGEILSDEEVRKFKENVLKDSKFKFNVSSKTH